MVASADNMRIGIIKEVTQGVTPTTPAFQLLRITGESLTFDVNTDSSPELASAGTTQSRGQGENALVGAVASGGIDFVLHKGPGILELLTGSLASDWGYDPGTVPITATEMYDSSKRPSYTIEKNFGLDGGLNAYHRYTGCSVDSLSLTITPNSRITGSFGFQGSQFITDDNPITGATYLPAGTAPAFTSPLVPNITLKDQAGLTVFDIGTSCFSNLQINLNNSLRGIPCIGVVGNREIALGPFTAEIQFSVYLSSNKLLEALRDQDEFELEITLEDPDGEQFVLTFPRIVISSATANGGGSGEDVIISGTMTALLGKAPDEYLIKIENKAASATPNAITAIAAGAGPASVSGTVTLTGGGGAGGTKAGTLTVNVTPDGGTLIPFTTTIAAGATPTQVATAIAAVINANANLSASAVAGVVTITPSGAATNITGLTATVT